MTFADKLRWLRDQAAFTQAALSSKSGLSLGVVRDYEQGNREPTLRSAIRLADALGVSVEVFVDCLRKDESVATEKVPRQPRGRPPKINSGNAEEPAPKRPRGRPRKTP
jgi:transcriptional regulator with XRE-family HTH domain